MIKGHENIIKSLTTMIAEDRLPHAIMFTGIAGIGKFLLGKALAAALLCEKENGPCGSCSSCKALDIDTHPDFFVLEPAGKSIQMIKIEQIRQMQKEISLSPYMADKRVVLLRNADMMNEAATNALLKTLEEPVGNTFFILTVDNEKQVLPTILSRCMRIHFSALTEDIIEQIALTHGAQADNSSQLAKLSGGSASQAISLIENEGLTNRYAALSFLKEIFSLSDEKMWTLSDELVSSGKEKFSEWLLYLELFWRDMIILDQDNDCSHLYNMDSKEELLAIKGNWLISSIFTAMSYAQDMQRRLLSNANIRLIAEKFIINVHDLK